MSKLADRLKPGAIFVTFTKGLSNKHHYKNDLQIQSSTFELLDKKRYKMSWGPATGNISIYLY